MNTGLKDEKASIVYIVLYLREILQDDSSWFEWDICISLGVFDPVKNFLNIGGEDVELVAVSHGRLEENSDGVWESLCIQIS